jgi:hypothetical protein
MEADVRAPAELREQYSGPGNKGTDEKKKKRSSAEAFRGARARTGTRLKLWLTSVGGYTRLQMSTNLWSLSDMDSSQIMS